MNAAQLSVDALARFGEYPSTYFQGIGYTNVQQMDRACQLATVLQRFGVQPGDRVVVMMPTCLEVPAAFQAIWRLGAVIVPVMPQLVARELKYIVQHSGAELVITSPRLVPCVGEATAEIPAFRQILVFGTNEEAAAVDVAPLVEAAAPCRTLCDCQGSDLAVLVYTSGTTGAPKGVMLSHDNLIGNARSVASVIDYAPDTRSMMVLPMSHVYGILLMNLGALTGGSSAMLPWFDATKALETIEQFQVQRCSLVPTMLIALINHPERQKYDVSSLQIVAAGSAPLSNEIRLEFERLFGCQVKDGYGQSEATCAVTAFRDDEPAVPGSVGRALPGVELCVMDDDGCQLPAGATGEICVRGPNVMQGYWKDEQATRAAIVDGWLHSGDVGHIDGQGYVFITDRKKDLIIKGAENISPREIEEAIYAHPAVAEVAVFGVADAKYQEEIAAAIVLKPGQAATTDQLRRQVAHQVTKFKIPRYFAFYEQLPKNSNGKVLKRALREQWAEPREAGAKTHSRT